jgi:type III secretory pathway component EscV
MFCFARLYYWLDFSPETSFQTLFILGLIPLNWIVFQLGFFDQFHFVLFIYLLVLITMGSIRIYKKKFLISGSQITVQLTRSKSFELDNSKPIILMQHSRGKLFNFGCILVPIVESNVAKNNLLSTVLFHKRHDAIFSGFYRMDGIRNPKEVIQNLKNKLTDEKI